MILPLPVKKNKFDDRVADISVEKYYRQINEEVLEAYKAAVNAEIKKVMTDEGCGQCAEYLNTNEAEEIVDVITCCVTRLYIRYFEVEDGTDEDFYRYLWDCHVRINNLPKNFYLCLLNLVTQAYRDANYNGEYGSLWDVLSICVKYLEQLGYDADARQKLYQAVNEKNRKRGYFEE